MAAVCRCGVPGHASKSSGLMCERYGMPAHGTACPHLVMTGGCYACDNLKVSNTADLTAKPGTAEDIGTSVRFTCWSGEKVIVGKTPMLATLTDIDLSREWNRRHPAAGDVGELQLRASMFEHERGAGITAKPPQSESLAHLDEDLLCEDA